MSGPIRVGTRRSVLALAQSQLVINALRRSGVGRRFTLCPMTTEGDQDRRINVSPDFTDVIEQQLEEGAIDLAVHSAKDLPVRPRRKVTIEAYVKRSDPRDCLVARDAKGFNQLHRGARLGSSSLRRQAQLLRWRPDLRIEPIRGNVDSRLRRVASGELDGVVLAAAGIQRLGRSSQITEYLDRRRLVPAPGQGALAVQVRSKDPSMAGVVRRIDHRGTRAAVTAEQAFASALGGDCNLPLGALATVQRGVLRLVGEVLSPDGKLRLRGVALGPPNRAREIGTALGGRLVGAGARRIMLHARDP